MNIRDLIKQCEARIRAGDINGAQQALRELNIKEIPGDLRFTIANLCRRTGLVTLGLKALTPEFMGDRDDWIAQVSPAEVGEYAVLLQRNGSVNEALKILERIQPERFPDAPLYRAYCHFNRWEYAEAVSLLQDYGKYTGDPYKKLIGQVNLAAAFVHTGRNTEATAVLEEVKRLCVEGGHNRLLANSMELSAQMAIYQLDFKRAKAAIEASAGLLGSANTVDQLFVRKLQSISEAVEMNSLGPLERFRIEAIERRDWESVRESDLFALKIVFDQDRFDHLIFGTPFSAYRDRVCKMLGREPLLEQYTYGDSSGPCLDLMSGEIKGHLLPTVGGKVHQLFDILLKDFYRPKSLGVLFSELFADEHYNVFSSSDRVHQILRRARAWLRESHIPVEILEENQAYSLRIDGVFGFQVPLERGSVHRNEIHMRTLRLFLEYGRVYPAAFVKRKLDLEGTAFRQFVTWAIEAGHIEREGGGPATSYRLSAGVKKAA